MTDSNRELQYIRYYLDKCKLSRCARSIDGIVEIVIEKPYVELHRAKLV